MPNSESPVTHRWHCSGFSQAGVVRALAGQCSWGRRPGLLRPSAGVENRRDRLATSPPLWVGGGSRDPRPSHSGLRSQKRRPGVRTGCRGPERAGAERSGTGGAGPARRRLRVRRAGGTSHRSGLGAASALQPGEDAAGGQGRPRDCGTPGGAGTGTRAAGGGSRKPSDAGWTRRDLSAPRRRERPRPLRSRKKGQVRAPAEPRLPGCGAGLSWELPPVSPSAPGQRQRRGKFCVGSRLSGAARLIAPFRLGSSSVLIESWQNRRRHSTVARVCVPHPTTVT